MTPLAAAQTSLDTQRGLPNMPSAKGLSAAHVDKDSALYKACEDFQSIFIKQMLESMRKTVDKSSGMVQQNEGEKVFEDMLYDERAKSMSKTAGFDLAANLYKQMAFLQNLPKTPV